MDKRLNLNDLSMNNAVFMDKLSFPSFIHNLAPDDEIGSDGFFSAGMAMGEKFLEIISPNDNKILYSWRNNFMKL